MFRAPNIVVPVTFKCCFCLLTDRQDVDVDVDATAVRGTCSKKKQINIKTEVYVQVLRGQKLKLSTATSH